MATDVSANVKILSTNDIDTFLESAQFGLASPLYTWRKGGTNSEDDDHLYLILGSAQDEVDVSRNVLIEIIPETKEVKFYGKTTLEGVIKFGQGNFDATSLAPHSVTSELLAENIKIDGSVKKLTTAQNIDGISFDGTSEVKRFSICTTSSSNGVKDVKVTNWQDVEGATLNVQFTDKVSDNFSIRVNETNTYTVQYTDFDGKLENLKGSRLIPHRVYEFVKVGSNLVLANELNEFNKEYSDLISLQLGKVYQLDKSQEDKDYPLTFKFSDNVLENPAIDDSQWTPQYGNVLDAVGFAQNLTYNPKSNTLKVGQIKAEISGVAPDFSSGDGSALLVTGQNGQSGIFTYHGEDGTFSLVGDYGSTYSEKITLIFHAKSDSAETTPTYEITLLDKEGKTHLKDLTVDNIIHGKVETAEKDNKGNVIDSTYLTIEEAKKTYVNPSQATTFTATVNVPAVESEQNTTVATVGYVEKIKTEVESSLTKTTQNLTKTINDAIEKENQEWKNKTINIENQIVLNKEQQEKIQKQLGLDNIGFDYSMIDGGTINDKDTSTNA